MTLITYRQIWLKHGKDYVYECVWSNGQTTVEITLPWGRLGDAKELPAL